MIERRTHFFYLLSFLLYLIKCIITNGKLMDLRIYK